VCRNAGTISDHARWGRCPEKIASLANRNDKYAQQYMLSADLACKVAPTEEMAAVIMYRAHLFFQHFMVDEVRQLIAAILKIGPSPLSVDDSLLNAMILAGISNQMFSGPHFPALIRELYNGDKRSIIFFTLAFLWVNISERLHKLEPTSEPDVMVVKRSFEDMHRKSRTFRALFRQLVEALATHYDRGIETLPVDDIFV